MIPVVLQVYNSSFKPAIRYSSSISVLSFRCIMCQRHPSIPLTKIQLERSARWFWSTFSVINHHSRFQLDKKKASELPRQLSKLFGFEPAGYRTLAFTHAQQRCWAGKLLSRSLLSFSLIFASHDSRSRPFSSDMGKTHRSTYIPGIIPGRYVLVLVFRPAEHQTPRHQYPLCHTLVRITRLFGWYFSESGVRGWKQPLPPKISSKSNKLRFFCCKSLENPENRLPKTKVENGNFRIFSATSLRVWSPSLVY